MNSLNARTSSTPRRAGLTLLELVVVIAILAIVAGFIVPLAGNLIGNGKVGATNANLVLIRDAIMGTQDKPGYLTDTGQLPTTLRDLFVQPTGMPGWNRDTALGWRGPYLISQGGQYIINNSAGFTSDYGSNGDPAILDAYGNPIILQIPTSGTATTNPQFARVISAGPNGTIDTSPSATYLNSTTNQYDPYPAPATRGDRYPVLFLQHSDSDP